MTETGGSDDIIDCLAERSTDLDSSRPRQCDVSGRKKSRSSAIRASVFVGSLDSRESQMTRIMPQVSCILQYSITVNSQRDPLGPLASEEANWWIPRYFWVLCAYCGAGDPAR
jgi:hypothetical protein